VPPGAKWGYGGIWCRLGPNYLETCDPEGVKEDFGRNLCRQGLKGKSTPEGSHVYRTVPPGAKWGYGGKKREAIF
jgi:hypothetical protein